MQKIVIDDIVFYVEDWFLQKRKLPHNNDKEFSNFLEYKDMLKIVYQKIPKNKTVLDIGANLGYISLPLAQKGYVVHTFEPVKNSYDCLVKSREANQFQNLFLHHCLVSDSEEKESQICVPYETDNASITKDMAFLNVRDPNLQIQVVPSITIDTCLENFGDIGYIKIDVQGSEGKVIRGMKNTLKKCKPPCILSIEWTPDFFKLAQENPEEIHKIITDSGFLFIRYLHGDRFYQKYRE
jgi:FkbM family methyltransferase